MSKTIALCFSTPGMDAGEFRNADYGKKYPGAGWMRHIPNAMSGLQTVRAINSGSIKPKDVYIVQEEDNPYGHDLQNMGAHSSVITCLESPIYASAFYDKKNELIQKWDNALLFDGGTEHLHFPSFDTEDIRTPVPWSDRKFLCMVTANKHYSGLPQALNESPSFRWALETQLHDYRYSGINHFMSNPGFDLFGKGWQTMWPPERECSNKLETISKYKFALCFENGSYPGYVTEKIIDCFVAGVVPVYMGDLDIDRRIPDDLYIEAQSDFKDMERYLSQTSDWGAHYPKMIAGAQDWLRTGDGQKYNNLNFAKRIAELCE